ncbi:cold-shock protein [Methylosinus sp. Sm6]|uniref:cold-shock protein n=1 Tax=Methylosinus sp. Sm6 TaxID=2866948 RepID=UPI001C99135B|nr:cold shock domain-containing protein [Methylosinus sp. Sm6]MBY6241723.1 cold shock domain-containing protein [Methylosinus sp. Sm6]
MSTEKTADDEQSADVSSPDAGLAAALRRLAGLPKAVAPQRVKWFDVGKGFGFVQPNGGDDVFYVLAGASSASAENELADDDYELIKTEAIALICAERLDSPQAHFDYISHSVAGALSKHAGT